MNPLKCFTFKYVQITFVYLAECGAGTEALRLRRSQASTSWARESDLTWGYHHPCLASMHSPLWQQRLSHDLSLIEECIDFAVIIPGILVFDCAVFDEHNCRRVAGVPFFEGAAGVHICNDESCLVIVVESVSKLYRVAPASPTCRDINHDLAPCTTYLCGHVLFGTGLHVFDWHG
mmetsp:Transcript_21152/g.41317  ORF Transcript_21152/g.41317 Transcript_21152/m.41317 type:complete len:176 (-) Transcript_21152:66-593(-)